MRPFSDVLAELRGGADFNDATEALAEVVTAVLDTRKAGDVTVKLSVSANADGTVNVKATVSKKVPEHDKRATVFFADDAGALVREDPRQTKFDLRESNTEKPIRGGAAEAPIRGGATPTTAPGGEAAAAETKEAELA